MAPDYERLQQAILEQYRCKPNSIHGLGHWLQVERIGLLLAKSSGADEEVVRLFALFHDACRWNDSHDDGHGARGAELARNLQGTLFELDDERLQTLCLACEGHTDGRLSDDATIATCWDADRLDLGRVGIFPHRKFMSTEAARQAADKGNLCSLQLRFRAS